MASQPARILALLVILAGFVPAAAPDLRIGFDALKPATLAGQDSWASFFNMAPWVTNASGTAALFTPATASTNREPVGAFRPIALNLKGDETLVIEFDFFVPVKATGSITVAQVGVGPSSGMGPMVGLWGNALIARGDQFGPMAQVAGWSAREMAWYRLKCTWSLGAEDGTGTIALTVREREATGETDLFFDGAKTVRTAKLAIKTDKTKWDRLYVRLSNTKEPSALLGPVTISRP